MTKFAGQLPRGESNGLEAIARALIDDPQAVQVLVVLADCKRISTDVDSGDVEATARIRRIEAIEGPDKEVAAKLLRRRFEQRTGKAVLSYDLEEDLRSRVQRCRPRHGGDPVSSELIGSLPDLIRDRVVHADNGCVIWTRSKVSGYGEVWVPSTQTKMLVHLYVWADGYDIGHVCHDRDLTCPGGGSCPHRACCRLDHLELQTRSQNNLGGRLGDVQRARHARTTHCPQGHPYDEKNTYWRKDRPAGGRMCRTCIRDRMRRRREDLRSVFADVDPETGEIR